MSPVLRNRIVSAGLVVFLLPLLSLLNGVASELGTSVGVELSVSPESAQVGTSARITVQNIGKEPLVITEISVIRPSGYRDVLNVDETLAAGDKLQFEYPQDWPEGSVTGEGRYTVELHVQGAIIESDFVRNLPPTLSLSTYHIDFGSVRVHSSDRRTFTVYNKGGGTLTVHISCSGWDCGNFSFSPSSFSVGAGGSRDVTVTYRPDYPESDAATLEISSNGGSAEVRLEGTGRGYCGDGYCTGSEDSCSCPSDCSGSCCGNGRCEFGEECWCATDCGPHCGNGSCDCGETRSSCPSDCSYCGDGVCDPGETRYTCPSDCGGDPPIFANLIAFPTPEKYLGRDLDGDGETTHTVLRYRDLYSCRVINTGLRVSGMARSIDLNAEYITFTSDTGYVKLYDLHTQRVIDTGYKGTRPSIVNGYVVFQSPTYEIMVYDLKTHRSWVVAQGRTPSASGKWVAFISGQPGTLTLYNLDTAEEIRTKIVASNPAVFNGIVAFETYELFFKTDLNGDGDKKDHIIQYYNIETGNLVNTGLIGYTPIVNNRWIVYVSREPPSHFGSPLTYPVVCYYNLKTGKAFNTHQYGIEPDIYGDTITYYVWESWIKRDLDGDGDELDPVVKVYKIPEDSGKL